ncbi:MAG: ABC transporter substrate binding protein [Chloroflexota bacterium]|nr:ABC transporter substrate binding protein [Chloroflexota bacterium]
MFKKLSALCFVLFVVCVPLGLADDSNPPRIAILHPDSDHTSERLQVGLMYVLQAYGFLDAEESAGLIMAGEVDGNMASVRQVAMPLDLPSINLLVEETLDWEPDAIVSISTEITQSVLNATLSMDDPPAVIFAGVFSPYLAGIASASCVKPDHVTGIQSVTPFEDIFPIFLAQMPDMRKVGTIFSSASAPGSFGAQRVRETGAELGLQVEEAAVNSVADLRAAAQSLLNEEIEAFVLPIDPVVDAGLPIVVAIATEYGVPVFHAATTATTLGATVGAGYFQLVQHGIESGLILAGYLNGELNIAATGIQSTEGFRVAISMDSAEALGMEIVDELMDVAFVTISGGETDRSPEGIVWYMQTMGMSMQEIRAALESMGQNEDVQSGAISSRDFLVRESFKVFASAENMARHAEFLQSLQCTDEMIAEQQAALDAAGG